MAAAGRAGFRENKGLRPCRSLVEQHLDDLRNNVAGALDDDGVALADLPALDFVFIVQSRPRDHDSANGHRLQVGDRRQCPGAADLDGDFVQHGPRPFRRELVGSGPARRTADHAQARLPVQPVRLVDDAVDIIGQGRAFGLHPIVQRYRFIDRAAEGGKAIDAEAPALEPLEKIPLCLADIGGGAAVLEHAPGIGEEAQLSLRRNRRVELAQRTGRGIARVGIERQSGRIPAGVQRCEIVLAHIDFAADFDIARRFRAFEAFRQVDHGPQIGRHVLADGAVSAGRAQNERAVAVVDRGRQAVDLRFGDDLDGFGFA